MSMANSDGNRVVTSRHQTLFSEGQKKVIALMAKTN